MGWRRLGGRKGNRVLVDKVDKVDKECLSDESSAKKISNQMQLMRGLVGVITVDESPHKRYVEINFPCRRLVGEVPSTIN